MSLPETTTNLPTSDSPDLILAHPTQEECVQIWAKIAELWSRPYDFDTHMDESALMMTVPLARDDGITMWITVDKNLPRDQRPILTSCETFRKRALASDAGGKVEEVVVHGVASVFTPSEYRGRGYASRHMRALASALSSWQQAGERRCAGTVLYSDVGREFYARAGWHPNPTNWHVEFPASEGARSSLVREVVEEDLPGLCERDEAMIREALAMPAPGVPQRVAMLPDINQLGWHNSKTDFVTQFLFGKSPSARGAIAGAPGCQVWATWKYSYGAHPDEDSSKGVLYIMRLVVEGDKTANKTGSQPGGPLKDADRLSQDQAENLEAVLQAARSEAAEWRIPKVKMWESSPAVEQFLAERDLGHTRVERDSEKIACGLWWDTDGKPAASPAWVNNEYYAWC